MQSEPMQSTSMEQSAVYSGRLNSLLFASLISLLYPASLYIWPNAINSDRHDPSTIKRNFVSVFLASFVSSKCLLLYHAWNGTVHNLDDGIFDYLNWKTYHSTEDLVVHCLLIPLGHVLILFAVPIYSDLKSLYSSAIVCDRQSSNQQCFNLVLFFSSFNIVWIRNLVVAPLTEEFIFRGILLSILLPSWSKTAAIIWTSILFGLMHIHHFLRSIRFSEQFDKNAALSALFQCIFTATFGSYAAVVYLASGHIITPIILHAFCNLTGLPNFELIFSNKTYLSLTFVCFAIWFFYLVILCLN